MSFVRSSVQTILVRLSLIAIGLLGGVINARWLGPEGVGIVALLLLVNTFAFRFGNLGFGSSFAYFVAREKAALRRVLPLTWMVSGVVSAVCVALLLASWRTSISPWNDILPSFFYIALLMVPLHFYNNYAQRVLSGRLKITAINIVSFTQGVANVAFLVLFIVILDFGVAGSILSSVLAELLMTVFFVWHCRREVAVASREPDPEVGGAALAGELWRYGRWTYLLMFANFLVEELPLVLLKKYTASNVLVGLFSRARNLGRQSRNIVEPVAGVLFPFTAASREEDAVRRTNILCRNSLLIMAATMGFMVIFIKPIILVLYGSEFLPAVPIFQALAAGVVIYPFGHFLEVHVSASGRPRDIFLASLSTLATGVVIAWALIPRFGVIGAGWSVSLIYLVRALFRYVAYVRLTGTSLAEVMLPRRQDLTYYKYLLKTVSFWPPRKAKVT